MHLLFQRRSTNEKRLIMAVGEGKPFPYVEAYKSLRTNLKFASEIHGAKSFAITSSIPEECKSNTAINLAVTLGQEDKKVLLMDCDLRKPAIHKYLKIIKERNGLTNILSDDIKIENCIVRSKNLKIDVLIAGAIPPNPSELLASERMKRLIEELRLHYDYIIVDTPPISVVTDAAVVGRLTDGALLVVRSKFAQTESVKLAKQKLEGAGIKIFGVILTCFDAKKSKVKTGYAASYQYDYYKEK